VVNDALASLDAEFDRLYAVVGRPAIAPERLIRPSLLQILFSIRSERQLMELMQYDLLFRWSVGLGVDDPVRGEGRPEICPVDRFQPRTGEAPGRRPTVFGKTRDRLPTTEMSRKVMAAILAHREVAPLLSDGHVPVDGPLIKAWASMKTVQPKPQDAPPRTRIPAPRPRAPPSISPPPIPTQRPTRCPAPAARAAPPTSSSGARNARTRPTPRPRTRTPGSTARRPAPCGT
jgi:hypothetical protein